MGVTALPGNSRKNKNALIDSIKAACLFPGDLLDGGWDIKSLQLETAAGQAPKQRWRPQRVSPLS